MNDPIVELENISFYYNNFPVLENIGLSICQKDLLAVIGPNGGGKSTLLKLILGLLKPSDGTIKLFGQDPAKGRSFAGYLPQNNFIDLSFPVNVYDVVLMGRYRGIAKKYLKEDLDLAVDALETVGMIEFKNRHISMLSGGQLQRVLIARAIVRNPKLLLLDEPMSGVDPEMQQSFYELILKLNKLMAIVFVTHDIGAISIYFNDVVCLNRKLFYHGPKEGSLKKLEETYGCPIELLAHGIPHRVLGSHGRRELK
jgi:zinc transport system ATP-binding protein